ncbi:MAG: phytanoyl-CoA dioxygenase family protein [Pseudomonadota bacterium]
MPLLDSSPILNDTEALRARAQADGYLFFRGLLPKTEVAQVRRDVLARCEQHHFFTDPIVDDRGQMDLDRLRRYYEDAYRLQSVHALPKHPAIIDVYSRLFGRTAVPHARTSLRTMPYGTEQVWPVHQDYLNVGTHDEVWNTWMPVGDCPQALGAIWMLPGSNRIGVGGNEKLNDHELFFEASGDLFNHPPAGLSWQTDDFLAGDVIMFNGLTYHRGAPNRLSGQFRISIDNCIQPIDTDFIPGAFELHRGDFGSFNRGVSWNDIYANWNNEDHQFYWKHLDLSYAQSIALEFDNA